MEKIKKDERGGGKNEESGEIKAEEKNKGGGRNLALLGVCSVVIAILTTVFSLVIYHNSGDIYLDRSRPGFLPDEEEIEERGNEGKGEYKFDDFGAIKKEDVSEYKKEFEKIVEDVKKVDNPYSEEALSDESLGI